MKRGKQRWLAPEVIQSSAMDCGPASLKCLLNGFGVSAHYGRLREACQTEVDGTSIDTLEEVAQQVGLDAEQMIVPLDHLFVETEAPLPALVVVRLPTGFLHFVVAWRRHGPFVQLMDPSAGRSWRRCADFLETVFVHEMPMLAHDWRAWAGSEDFLARLRQRLVAIGGDKALIERALEDASWRALTVLDAAIRMVSALVDAGACDRHGSAARLLADVYRRVRDGEDNAIPETYWSARPMLEEGEEETLTVRGAVLLKVSGVRSAADEALPVELAEALRAPEISLACSLWQLLKESRQFLWQAIAIAIVLSSAGAVMEALLFRSVFDLGYDLRLLTQRYAAIAVLGLFGLILLALEWPIVGGSLRLARHLDVRLRLSFLAKVPRLSDRYFQSRAVSDMLERNHNAHFLRAVPELVRDLLRALTQIVVTTAAIVWLDPASGPLAVPIGVSAAVVPFVFQLPIRERDLRLRTYLGALAQFSFDAFLGLVPLHAHRAHRALRREHESVLVAWIRTARDLLGTVLAVEALQLITGMILSAGLLLDFLQRRADPASAMLLAYWAMSLPMLGLELASSAQQLIRQRSLNLRLLEPLGAPEEASAPAPASEREAPSGGVSLAFEKVEVRAAGHVILSSLDLRIEAGEHVAIVGPSGAGKSSLVGLLLGWHRPAAGMIRVDGQVLDASVRAYVRGVSAWVDPAVQLWNQRLVDNLCYGLEASAPQVPLADVIDSAEIKDLLESLPDGMLTPLGESGALVSGGEGQRVRFGRALQRRDARLVILDEAFRGLERVTRQRMLARARRFWPRATLLCITHDIEETRDFARVLVVEGGCIVEDGVPSQLLASEGSHYRALLMSEQSVKQLWNDERWRHWRLEAGRIVVAKGEP